MMKNKYRFSFLLSMKAEKQNTGDGTLESGERTMDKGKRGKQDIRLSERPYDAMTL
jgi:hypothetical protein